MKQEIRLRQEKRLLHQMMRIRMLEEEIVRRYPEQEMRCPVHLCIGQEAVAAGVCAALDKRDFVFSAHRSHGHYLAKGGNMRAMMAEIYGKVTGCCRGKGGSMHLVDLSAGFLGAVPIVASTIPIAVGAAFSARQREEDRVIAVFFGEGATEEGVFHESLNFAVLKKLPVVFVCENNAFSVNTPLCDRRPEPLPIFALAEAHGAECYSGDGNNVMDVFEKATDAIEFTRGGNGPAYLEFETYRWREHCGPNDDHHLSCRSEAEFARWKARCPVETFKNKLIGQGLITLDEFMAYKEEIEAEVGEAFEFAKRSPFPEFDVGAEGVYAP